MYLLIDSLICLLTGESTAAEVVVLDTPDADA